MQNELILILVYKVMKQFHLIGKTYTKLWFLRVHLLLPNVAAKKLKDACSLKES